MKNKKLRRLLAGASTAVIAVGFAATFGAPVASAASVNQSTNSGQWTFNRTISNGTPAPGDTITVTNAIRWNGGLAPTISALKDIHPACLTYVANSSKVNGDGVTTNATNATYVSMTGSWIRSAANRNIDYTLNYTVGANCARDIALITGAGISSNQSLGSETANAGPSLTVAKSATQTALAVAPAPQSDRASTLTATVSAGATGTVEFRNNGTLLGTGTIANGTATYAWTPTGADAGQPFSVTAKYLGDATYAISTSAAQTGTVAAAPTAPAAPTDLSVTPASVVVGGTVTVSGKAEANSSVTVTAGDKTCTATATAAGAFSCDIVTSAAGTLTVTAVAANVVGTGAASAPVTVTVSDPAPVDVATTLVLGVPAAAETGASVDVTATVTPASAAGTVSFKVAGVEIGTAPVVNGAATLSHVFAVVGVQSVSADFSGAGFTASSAGPSTVTVSDPAPVDVATTLVLGVPAAAETGASVDVTATVTPASAAGTVSFKVAGVEIGTAPVVNGAATLSHVFAVVGVQSVSADFSGAGFTASSAGPSTVTVSDPVVVDTTSTTVLSVAGEAKVGVALDLSAAVAGQPSGDPAPSGGTVDFKVNGNSVGSAPVVNGAATLPYTFTGAGTATVTAVYSGAGTLAGSTSNEASVNVTVETPIDADSTTTLTVPASGVVGTAASLKANVSPMGSVGTVQFFEGTVPLGAAVNVVNGVAVLDHVFTTTGSHTVTAVFSGGLGVKTSISTPSTIDITAVDDGTGGTGSLGSLGNIFGS
ncbi:Ig-like domain-containing protein [Rhodococcus sp. ARC_M6]|uniref:beta strand repeat-containing protein n=1 Tax=Rhodococcus sp. ARC_M6 TaxID=2928852 RepID=UPI001FB1AC48|nr:Ig-like domain-containing protein [Rhodococcus sp. ARC_M6]MCJ0904342.1 Ig-like domain repeat protein [Rhodococcus sp. ARC_M6]